MPNTLSHKSGLSYRGLRFFRFLHGSKKWKQFISFFQNLSLAENYRLGSPVAGGGYSLDGGEV